MYQHYFAFVYEGWIPIPAIWNQLQTICIPTLYHFHKKFHRHYMNFKSENFSYVSYSIRVNQSSLKYLNLFQENMPFSDIQVSGCFYTFWLLLHISTSETAEILVSTMHYRSQQTSTLSGKPAMAWKNIKECSLNYDRTTHNPHKLVFLCTFLAHPRRQLPIP